MRISDWSSDVCSSDLHRRLGAGNGAANGRWLVPARDAGHWHWRHRRKGCSARKGKSDGRDRYGAVETARPAGQDRGTPHRDFRRSEEHTSELQSLMRISYAVFCLKKKKENNTHKNTTHKNLNKN